MLPIINNPRPSDFEKLCQRPVMQYQNLHAVIDEIFQNVRTSGDQAVLDYTFQFDKVKLEQLTADFSEFTNVSPAITQDLKNAIDVAFKHIHSFHAAQVQPEIKVRTMQGVECRQKSVPIQCVGLYIPGGSTPLFSTVLMLGVPAKIAGCREIILCTPPDKSGQIHPAILYAAHLCGITRIFPVGGSQAIAAMTFGTESIPKVDKIFGPGNQYVTYAKQYAQNFGVAIDMPAGPSEVLVYADETAVPEFVAADLLAQAEHGPDSQVILVADSVDFVHRANEELAEQSVRLPRFDIIQKSLLHSKALIFDDREKAFQFINQYAPEHLIIASDNALFYESLILNAGSVFLGNYCPESAGDYASGTNHTLPTNGWAKSYSGVNTDAFFKKITLQTISPQGIQNLADTIITMAESEQLAGHARAVSIRLENIKNK
jgi:histidinol dehydrogenase